MFKPQLRKLTSRTTFVRESCDFRARLRKLTLQKCCACHEICTWPCKSAATATKYLLDIAKVLRLPHILHLTLRKCCTCQEVCTWPCESAAPAMNFAHDLAKVLRLPRNLHMTLWKCCACHEICTSPCESAAPATQFNPCETSALPCQWASAPSMVRTRSERAPRVVRPGAAANRLAFGSPETHGTMLFAAFYTPTTRASRALIPSLHLSQRELAFN